MADGENLHPSCQEFRDNVARRFRDLLDQNTFQIVHQESTNFGARCLLVFGSERCRLRFIFDRGGVEVHIGSINAEVTWSGGEEDRRQWFALRQAVAFVEGRRGRTIEEVREISRAAWEMSSEQYLERQAAMLRPVIGEICQLFVAAAPAERREALERYLMGQPCRRPHAEPACHTTTRTGCRPNQLNLRSMSS